MTVSEAIAELAADAFGLGHVAGQPVSVDEAWSNQVLRIATRSGRYAVKVFTGVARDALETGCSVEASVGAMGRIPIPTPVAAADGSWIVEVDTDQPRLLRCHRWVDSTPCSSMPPSAAIAADVGRSLGFLHALRLDGGDSSQLPPVELDRWDSAVARASHANVAWAQRVADLAPLVGELASHVQELREARLPMRLSHDDLDPKNAVVRPDGSVVITDWDYAGPVLPDLELVVAAVSFAGGVASANPDLVRTFVHAYRDAGGDATDVDPQRTAIEAGRIDWILRNIDAALRPASVEETTTRNQAVHNLLTSFADNVAQLRTWATRISSM